MKEPVGTMAGSEVAPELYSISQFKRDAMYILYLWGQDGELLSPAIAGHITEGDFRAAEAVSWLMSTNDVQITTELSKTYYSDRGRPEVSAIAIQTFIQHFRNGPSRDSHESVPTNTFTLFSSLPLELRLKIWALALPGPKFVEFQSIIGYLEDGEVDLDIDTWKPICEMRAPVLFFVCRESRKEVERFYQPIKGNEQGSPGVYCDLAKDVFCFTYSRFHLHVGPFLRRLLAKSGQKISYIALEFPVWNESWPTKKEDLLDSLDLRGLLILDDRDLGDQKIKGFVRNDGLEDPDDRPNYFLTCVRVDIKDIGEKKTEWKAPETMAGKLTLIEG